MEEGSSTTRGTHWTSSPLDELDIKVGKEGSSSFPPVNVFVPFRRNAKEYPDKVALSTSRDGKTVTYTWKQYYDQVVMCARAIRTFTIAPNSGINILGFNSPEWFFADLAAIAAGGIAAPIYTTNGPEAVQYIAHHSEAVVAFVENELQLKKYLAIRKDLPHLKAIVQWSGTVPKEQDVYSWNDFLELGQKTPEEEVLNIMQELKPTKCCTLIYTSGTTGPPKAVMLSNDNISWTAQAAGGHLQVTNTDRMVSYLPLSHIAAQMVDLHIPICFTCTTFFAQPDALKGSLATTLKEARPTLFLGVPRVWEKMQEKMMEVAKSSSGLKKNIASWAKGVGLKTAYAQQEGTSKPWGGWIANYLVYSKVREALGLDQARLCGSAAAPIAKETLEFFYSLGIPIYEIYGMSESTGPQTVDTPWAFRIGTTGKIFEGAEIKIDNPDKDGNGEILFRGRHVFMGYMKDAKSTSETIDNEGWLHSGDIGRLDDGFLSITGRIKELIITAGGENIPPVLIEDEIKKELGQVISNVMIIGDRKKFLSCLITLRAKPLDVKPGDYPFSDELADSVRNAVGDDSLKTVEDGVKSEALRKYIQSGIEKANKRATSNAQRIQKFELLKKDFTIETGELTPTLKLKRRIVVQQNAELIDQIYNVED